MTTSAVEHVREHVDLVLNQNAGETWQIEIGESLTLDDFLAQNGVRLPAAFISFGGFTADPERIAAGRCELYEDRIVVYLLKYGDMWPWATAIRDHFNAPRKPDERYANNEFKDARGILQRLTIISGDGIKLPSEGIPAFELVLTV